MESKRLVISIEKKCNNNCKFCFNKNDTYKTSHKNNILIIKNNKKTNYYNELVISGGEPTINKNLIKLIKTAKRSNFNLIQIQSNARILSSNKKVTELIKAGANQFYISVHGSNSKIHDNLTQVSGAFKQTIKGIKNLKKHNITVLTNTVINKENYNDMPKIVSLLNFLKIELIQLVFISPEGNALKYPNIIPRYSEIINSIKRSIKNNKQSKLIFQGIPYCFMNGYESYIKEHNDYVDILEFDLKGQSDFKELRKNLGKVKGKNCYMCKYFLKCEGIWREYSKIFGVKELKIIK